MSSSRTSVVRVNTGPRVCPFCPEVVVWTFESEVHLVPDFGLSGPVREVVVIRPGDEVGVEFRRDELSVHCLVLAFFFATILQFDLRGLSFNLSDFSFYTHQVI